VDHYEVLGVTNRDEAEVIRRAYLAQARRYHPDFHADADETVRAQNARRMQALNEAWAVLGDPAARSAYDREQSLMADPGFSRRAAREPTVPPGKGWTPRPGDDRWMDDFDGWANERDDLVPEPPPSAGTRILTMLPVGLFATSVACFALGVILTARPLLALAAIAFALSIAMFVFAPMLAMTRGRRRG
jgi:hypothetical protein